MHGSLISVCREFHQFPLVGMRRLAAILGALIVPICYLTLRNMGHSRSTCTLAAILLILGKKKRAFSINMC